MPAKPTVNKVYINFHEGIEKSYKIKQENNSDSLRDHKSYPLGIFRPNEGPMKCYI